MQSRVRTMLAAALLTASACGPKEEPPSGTAGELGRVEFSYVQGCFFGCPLEQPLLAGTSQRIGLEGEGDARGLRVRSGDEDVARFALERECYCTRPGGGGARVAIAEDASCTGMAHEEKHCDNIVLVEAGEAGEAELELLEADGELLDRTLVRVAEAERARVRVTPPDQPFAAEADAIELRAGESAEVELTLYDGDGRELLATDGVLWTVADSRVAEVSAWLIGPSAELNAGLDVVVKALAAGETELIADVPGLAVRTAITVNP